MDSEEHPVKSFKRLIVAVIALAFAGVARADFIAYDVTSGLVGNQVFSGSVGMNFDTTAGATVTQLGVFDSGGDGLVSSKLVQLYDRDTQSLITSTTIAAGTSATLINGSRFVAITPILLTAGHHYTIVASGFTTADPLYNSGFAGAVVPSTLNTGGGILAFVGTGRYANTPGVFPTIIDTIPRPNPYAAGTFQFTAVPEPGSIALFGIGTLGLIGYRRLRNRSTLAA